MEASQDRLFGSCVLYVNHKCLAAESSGFMPSQGDYSTFFKDACLAAWAVQMQEENSSKINACKTLCDTGRKTGSFLLNLCVRSGLIYLGGGAVTWTSGLCSILYISHLPSHVSKMNHIKRGVCYQPVQSECDDAAWQWPGCAVDVCL